MWMLCEYYKTLVCIVIIATFVRFVLSFLVLPCELSIIAISITSFQQITAVLLLACTMIGFCLPLV